MIYTAVTNSPIGPITLFSDGEAITGIYLQTQPFARKDAVQDASDPVLLQGIKWLARYFSGQKPDPQELPLSPDGTPFQRRIWARLLQIPYGKCTTYGAIAKEISPTMSAQAVGNAVGRNPISIVIPCHRVIGSDGSLIGYAGGLENKKFLLKLEGFNL